MSDDSTEDANGSGDTENSSPTGGGLIRQLDIQDEMKSSYLTYAMSVIVSRALPDVRDGLKPSQRRILVAMNDLNLGAGGKRTKCAKIAGDTSGNYHPHGQETIYPTLVRMAQVWVMREVLIDKQGNFGSLAGLPPAAMRYTEARMSYVAAEMLRDIDSNTVDFVPNYLQDRLEPVVLPSRFPNLVVNGSNGIAVGMATSIPPHNLSEVTEAVKMLIDNPEATVDEILDILPGPDFPTGGVICGRFGIRQGYSTGRATITVRARTHFDTEKNSDVIVVTEIPYLETRDRIKEKLELLVKDEKIKGISRIVDLTDRNIPDWQVHLQIILKRDADKEVVLNQLYRYSPLQTTFSLILLALSSNRPVLMTIKEMLIEFIRHRVNVIRRRTEFLLSEARKRKHTVEGLLIAQLDIDQIINTIRQSPSRNEAKVRLQDISIPAEMVARALGDNGFKDFVLENGEEEEYHLSPNQTEAIVSMQLGSLANLEREKLSGEHAKLLEDINGYLHLLSDEKHILGVVRDDMEEIQKKFPDKRRTEISELELTNVDKDALITEEKMVVTLTRKGYIKRSPLTVYQAQNRGGKGITGAKSDDEDPTEHVFVSSTHSFLLFFTNFGKVYWQKVYDLPLQNRTAKGRAIVNLLNLGEGEQIANCVSVDEFADDQFLLMGTRKGIIKKTMLSAYSRPMKGGIIGIKLDEDDQLIGVLKVSLQDDIVLATRNGMSIRFSQRDARAMGRNTRGVKGISLVKGDMVVGMVVAHPEMCLFTACENGYGKRTPFGDIEPDLGEEVDTDTAEIPENTVEATELETATAEDGDTENDEANETRSTMMYRRQRRGGKGVRDIRTSARNGKVVAIIAVADEDEVIMITSGGKIQRIRAKDISQVGRNTQGVRVIRLYEKDALASIARIPADFVEDQELITTPPIVEEPNSDQSEDASTTENTADGPIDTPENESTEDTQGGDPE